MMAPDSDAFATWLNTELGALTWTTSNPRPTMRLGPMADSPDRFVGMLPYGGQAPDNNWQGAWRVQLPIRGRAPGTGIVPYQDATLVKDAVERIVAPPGDQFRVIDLPGGRRAVLRLLFWAYIGPDTKLREQFTINVGLDSVRA